MPMMVCPRCGSYDTTKTVRPISQGWADAVCPDCHDATRFRYLPLFVITGASGAGKTTAMHALLHTLDEVAVIESDILWGAIPADEDGSWTTYRHAWMRLALGIGQAGKPVALFGAALPADFESAPYRRYFPAVHYLALTCHSDELARRLRARPAWRGSGTHEFVEQHVQFNQLLLDNASILHPRMDLLDTTSSTVEETAAALRRWIHSRV